ncbi:uncharacterized protein [Palaemon carinicauda]|uniref:uncharacterized protein n=1 Tax=Palaemon carinicauda TaxID=392227 RepID=UPI0035B5FA5C
MNIKVCYALPYNLPEERKDDYYEEVYSVVDEIPVRNMEIGIGDLNAEVVKNNPGIENVIGVHGLDKVANENRAIFMNICSTNNLVIGAEERHCWMEYFSEGMNKIYGRNNLIDIPEADVTMNEFNVDQQLLIATLKLKLRAPNRKVDRIPMCDTTKLSKEEHRETIGIKCRTRFDVLETLRDEEQTITEEWCDINNPYQSVGGEV